MTVSVWRTSWPWSIGSGATFKWPDAVRRRRTAAERGASLDRDLIGEAARGVSDKVRDAHPEVPWRVITDMRNRRRARRMRGAQNGHFRAPGVHLSAGIMSVMKPGRLVRARA